MNVNPGQKKRVPNKYKFNFFSMRNNNGRGNKLP
jgi:hypothetical protein